MPSSSLFLRSCTTLVPALLLSTSSATSNQYYAIDTTYQGPTFFDGFSFFSAADPTHGFVDYLSRSNALSANLISYGSAQPARMKVDASSLLTPPTDHQYYNQDGIGRKSVRIESVKSWTHGLIILDIDHLPTSATDGCGTWPAFWTLGSGTWPQNGEMDIIEGANDQVNNFAAGHTGSTDKTRQCAVANSGGSGDLIYGNCNLYSTDPWGNSTNPSGCKIEDKTDASYGKPFNDNEGGVYAMEWTSEYIKTYFFPRGSIPANITEGTPDPSKWPAPFGVFSTPCDIDSNYNNMQIIFDTTFCGDFGDATWGSSCATKTGFDTCAKYVASKPQDFAEAYWQIESLEVYTLKDKPVTTTSSSTTLSTTIRSTTTSTTPSYSTRDSSSKSSATRSSSSSSSSSTTTSSSTPSSATSSSSTTTPSYIRSASITSLIPSTLTSSASPTVGRSSTKSASSSTAYPSAPVSSTSASSPFDSSSYIRSSSSSPSLYLSSTTSTSTSAISKSDFASSSFTYATSSTKIGQSIDPAFATTSANFSSTTYFVSWEDWSSSTSSIPATSTSSMTPSASYDTSHSWADWSTSSSSVALSASTSSALASNLSRTSTWTDWQVSATASGSCSSDQVGGQYHPASNASAEGTPGEPTSASVVLTTMTIQPTPPVRPDATQVWGGAMGGSASAAGSQLANYAGITGTGIANESGSLVSPSIATYTANTAVRTERTFAAVAVLAGAIILVP